MKSFKQNYYYFKEINLALDTTKMNIENLFLDAQKLKLEKTFSDIQKIEAGDIMNPDENRMVGHYWLRNPELAPNDIVKGNIINLISKIKLFVKDVHEGRIKAPNDETFKNILLIGIGGSCLGPQFVSRALLSKDDKMKICFMDNTDPDGMDLLFDNIKGNIDKTIVIVISKSGVTIETRNCMHEVRKLYESHGLDFSKYAIAITEENTKLYKTAVGDNWLEIFPVWDFVGGRTSVTSAVGLLPLALQGIDIDLFLEGAQKCDDLTRKSNPFENPAAILAMSWYYATTVNPGISMVILPYKDRLRLLTIYLQQLIMESLGKELDLKGNIVNQGIAVYGNKGTTDQHSYLQQLLDGPDNSFVTFIEVLKDRVAENPIVGENSTSGDFLSAFYLGARTALAKKGRKSITITIDKCDARSIGTLIALYERAVTIYASMVNINAYNQPAAEFGKKFVNEIIALKNQILEVLSQGGEYTTKQLAEKIDSDEEIVFKIMRHLLVNEQNIVVTQNNGDVFEDKYIMLC